MMNFDERRAEIFRRSDERIKERKRNRRRILLSCVPIVICIGVLSVSYGQNKLNTETPDGIIENAMTNNSLVYPITVELTDLKNGESREIEACYDIATVTDIIYSMTDGRYQTDNYGIPTESTDSDQYKDISKADSYEITITREIDGKTKINVFFLNGNVIIDKETQQEYQLSDDEYETLLRALGLKD